MAIKAEHEIHQRRFSRNLGVGIVLGGFVALLFALSVVKVKRIGPIQGYDQPAPPALTEPGQ